MKKIAALLLMMCAGIGFSQTPVVQGPTISYSKNGYPHFAMPGSNQIAYVQVYGEEDPVSAWSWNGVTGSGGRVTYTTPGGNNLTAGDWIQFIESDTSAPNNSQLQMGTSQIVFSATSTTFTIATGMTSGSATSGSPGASSKVDLIYSTNGTFKGTAPYGTWTITNTGTDTSETYQLATQDGNTTTSFSTNPTLTNQPPFMTFNVGTVEGDCQTSGNLNTSNRVVHSPIEFDVKFTLASDASQTFTTHYVVCKNGGGYAVEGKLYANPGFRLAYKNRNIPIVGQVFGHTNQMVNWSIVSAPVGGDGSLLYATYPQPVFQSGTVAGKYKIHGCPAVDSSAAACADVVIHVVSTAPPAGNNDGVEQVPCEAVAGISWATQMDIGPTKTYPDLLSIPQSYAGPAIFRVFNEGAPGSPTEYHNQVQFNLPSGGPFTPENPSTLFCGVPNSAGELPIISGNLATAAPWTNENYVVGSVGQIGFLDPINDNTWTNHGTTQPNSYFDITGFHFKDIRHGISFFKHDGTLADGSNYALHANGVVQNYNVIGNFATNVATPFFDDCHTSQNNWPLCSLDTFYEGNHAYGYGTNGTATEHMFYLQSIRDTALLNWQEGSVIGSQGTQCYSDRGTRSFHMYNFCSIKSGYSSASGPGGHSDKEDMYQYILPDTYFGIQGQGTPTCTVPFSASPDCQGSFGGANWYAALLEESNNGDFNIGNLYYSANGTFSFPKYFGIEATHVNMTSYILQGTNVQTPAKGFVSYNLVAVDKVISQGGWMIEDRRFNDNPASVFPHVALYMAVFPRGFIENNIIPWRNNSTCGNNCTPFGNLAGSMNSFGKNLVAPGQVTITTGINAIVPDTGNYVQGLNRKPSGWDLANVNPIESHYGGWTVGNFPMYANAAVLPYDTTTFRPTSEAVGKAGPCHDQLCYYPPRFNAVDPANPGVFTLRTDLTTVGPYDPVGGPAAPSGLQGNIVLSGRIH